MNGLRFNRPANVATDRYPTVVLGSGATGILAPVRDAWPGRAALIYLHSTDDRQRTLAETVSERALRDMTEEECGTSLARHSRANSAVAGLPDE